MKKILETYFYSLFPLVVACVLLPVFLLPWALARFLAGVAVVVCVAIALNNGLKVSGIDLSQVAKRAEAKARQAQIQQERQTELDAIYRVLPDVLAEVTGKPPQHIRGRLVPNGYEYLVPRGTCSLSDFDSEKILGGIVSATFANVSKVVVSESSQPGFVLLLVLRSDPLRS